jgi:hypothetical protein
MTPLELFSDLVVIDEKGESHVVPIEKVESKPAKVVKEDAQWVQLPYLYLVEDKGCRLYAWTLYVEEMNQIVEQVIIKFGGFEGKNEEAKLALKTIDNTQGGQGDGIIELVFGMEKAK